ncbi:uncharacterized protein N7511_007048 [Penicillium nucicola]|uniref:uncharacterized protein n=1 Tax=Penicillium nucicola TaxID=1850975 RepID=UPI002545472A|nr:uncharacterized protein N7511_007048 [Penicillium nucicola]KAJ5758354.1 hypothetical protein N7511_007048 [Penicillium nucicola]
MILSSCLFLVLGSAWSPTAASSTPDFLYRDVVVVGGGASGAYAAVRLRDDFNKSIALIEKQSILGGMVDTFVDKKTGGTYDFGVQSFLNVSNSMEFFKRFNISVGSGSTGPSLITKYVDFNTGEKVDFEPPSFEAQIAAVSRFLKVIEPWESLLRPGYWNFPKPSQIPDDLLIPFGQFLTKYNLEEGAPIIYSTTGLGVGNMSEVATMFALQSFGWDMARGLTGEMGLYVPTSGGIQSLYNAIATDLGDDVFYSSTVIETRRTNWGVFLTVRSHKTGKVSVIVARRLLVAIEPTKENMAALDLSPYEQETLSKFTYSNEFTGLVDNPVFNKSYSYFNLPSTAAPDHYLVFQEEPATVSFAYSGLGHLFRVMIIGNNTSTDVEAKHLAQTSFNTLLNSGHLSGSIQNQRLNWAAFSTHGPMHARVSVAEVKAGFYQDLYKLQGSRCTWWTGGAFAVNFQTKLWEFDEVLIPKLLEGL